jgi:hypothetical protein
MYAVYKEFVCHGKKRLCLYIEADCHGDSEYYCVLCLEGMMKELIAEERKRKEKPCGD